MSGNARDVKGFGIWLRREMQSFSTNQSMSAYAIYARSRVIAQKWNRSKSTLTEGCDWLNKWTKEWPTEEGFYWLYSYRYGKISCGYEQKPELMLMEVHKISNGFMGVANGQIVYESEVEEPWFQKAVLPELPES